MNKSQEEALSIQNFMQKTVDPDMQQRVDPDPLKPFKFIQEKFDSFKINCEQTQMTADAIKERFQNVQPLKGDTNYQSYCCVICLLIANEPLICSECETAVMCQICKDGWQIQKRGNFECPNCLSQNKTRKLTRKEIEARDSIQVICPACPNQNNQMPLSKYVSHKCKFKPRKCPQNCDSTINSFDKIDEHYRKCENSIVICNCCSSQVKKSQINIQIFSQLKKQFDEKENQNDYKPISIRFSHLQKSDGALLNQSINLNDIEMIELKQHEQEKDQQEKSIRQIMKQQSDYQIELLRGQIQSLTKTIKDQDLRHQNEIETKEFNFFCSLLFNTLFIIGIIPLAIFLVLATNTSKECQSEIQQTRLQLQTCQNSQQTGNPLNQFRDGMNITVGNFKLANVEFQTNGAIRGRAEFYRNGQWGTICDDGWSSFPNNPKVFCGSLNLPKINAYWNGPSIQSNKWSISVGPINMGNVYCSGTERSLEQCSQSTYYCSHGEDVIITCD